jgi:hypothetical protein
MAQLFCADYKKAPDAECGGPLFLQRRLLSRSLCLNVACELI